MQPGTTNVERSVSETDGWTWRLPSVPLAMRLQSDKTNVLCQDLYEVVPDDVTAPGRSYEFRAIVEESARIRGVDEQILFAVDADENP